MRHAVMHAAAQIAHDSDPAAVLGLAASTTADLRAAAELTGAPTAKAHQLYSGVLFEAANFTGEEKSAEAVMIFSGLFGVVQLNDNLPAYRLPASVKLPHLPDGELTHAGESKEFSSTLAAFWRTHLKAPLNGELADKELIIDCRSATYEAMYKPAGALAERTYKVAVMRQTNGKRSVVSHNAKYARGLLAGALIRAEHTPKTIEEVAAIAATLRTGSGNRFLTEISASSSTSRTVKPGVLSLIERAD